MASWPLKQGDDLARGDPADGSLRPIEMHAESWKSSLTSDLLIAWKELEEDACEPNPFYQSWHLPTALEAFDAEGAIKLVQFWQNGVLSGIFPVERTNSYYGYPLPHLRAWLHDNAFCGVPLVRAGSETAFWDALPKWASANAFGALFLHLSQIPEHGPMFGALRQSLRSPDTAAAIVHRVDRAMLHSKMEPDEYLEASMSGKKRKELRRQFNRLSDLGEVTFDRQTGSEGLDSWITAFLALENSGWKGRENSALASSLLTEQYFRGALQTAGPAGKLERLTLLLDGKPLAMLVNFHTPPGAFSFKTTFDEDFSRFSPGVLLQRENLSLLSCEDIDWTDSCAAADHPMIERIWREKRSIVRVNISIGGALRQAAFRQLVRAESSASMIDAKG